MNLHKTLDLTQHLAKVPVLLTGNGFSVNQQSTIKQAAPFIEDTALNNFS